MWGLGTPEDLDTFLRDYWKPHYASLDDGMTIVRTSG
jgi:hypothetical protein